jgi:predicted DNA-binding transcriptional regulator YafY
MKRAQWVDEDQRRRRFDAATRRQRVLLHLEGKVVLSAQQLADMEGVSLRTIWRDIDTLRHMHGHNIVSSHGPMGGYMLRPKVLWPHVADQHGEV